MDKFYEKSVDEVQEELRVTLDKGLSTEEVEKRLTEYGKNRLTANSKALWL